MKKIEYIRKSVKEKTNFRFVPVFMYGNMLSISMCAITMLYTTIRFNLYINNSWYMLLIPTLQYLIGSIVTMLTYDFIRCKIPSYGLIGMSAIFNIGSIICMAVFYPENNSLKNYIGYCSGVFLLGQGSQLLARINNDFLKTESKSEAMKKYTKQVFILVGLGAGMLLPNIWQKFSGDFNQINTGEYFWVLLGLVSFFHIGQFIEIKNFTIENNESSVRDLKVPIKQIFIQRRVAFLSISIMFSNLIMSLVQYDVILDSLYSTSYNAVIVFGSISLGFIIILLIRMSQLKLLTARFMIFIGNILVQVGAIIMHPFWNGGEDKYTNLFYPGVACCSLGSCIVHIFAPNEILVVSAYKYKLNLRHIREKAIDVYFASAILGNIIGIILFCTVKIEYYYILFLVISIAAGLVTISYAYEFFDTLKWMLKKKGLKRQSRPHSLQSDIEESNVQDVILYNSDIDIETFNLDIVSHLIIYGKYFTIDLFCTSSVDI